MDNKLPAAPAGMPTQFEAFTAALGRFQEVINNLRADVPAGVTRKIELSTIEEFTKGGKITGLTQSLKVLDTPMAGAAAAPALPLDVKAVATVVAQVEALAKQLLAGGNLPAADIAVVKDVVAQAEGTLKGLLGNVPGVDADSILGQVTGGLPLDGLPLAGGLDGATDALDGVPVVGDVAGKVTDVVGGILG